MAAGPEKKNGFSRVGIFFVAFLIALWSFSHPLWAEINVASGNLSHSQTLFKLPNAKFLGEFNLTYNSLSSQNDVLGKGWTHTFNIGLAVNTDGTYTLTREDGSKMVLSGSGPYTPDNSPYPALTINGNGTAILQYRDGLTYNFDTDKKVTSIMDRNSNTITLTYTNGNLTGIADPNGRIITLAYNAGKISTISDPNSNTHTFTITDGNLTGISSQISNLDTQTWGFTYLANSFMQTLTDPLGNVTSYVYGSDNKITQVTDPEGRTRLIAYNTPAVNSTQVTEKDGGVWVYTFDPSLGFLTPKKDPYTKTIGYAYDTDGNLASLTDQRGKTTSYTYYDATSGNIRRNVKTITNAKGEITTYTYNSLNKVTKIEYPHAANDPQNDTINLSYDANGNLLSLTDAATNVWQFTYDTNGNLKTVVSPAPLSKTTTFNYQNNFLTEIIEPVPVGHTYFQYDSAGNVTRFYRDSQTYKTDFAYNGLNKTRTITDALNHLTQFNFDLSGNLTSVTDANSKTTQYEYNYQGQVAKITDALGNITAFAYGTGCPSCGGGVDQVTSVIDPLGNTTRFEYDLTGRLTKETDPLGHSRTYSYTINTSTNRVTLTDARGNQILYDYDDLNRLTTVTYPDQTTKTFGYNDRGNLTSAANPNISYALTYDPNNRLTGVTGNGKSVGYQYNVIGNRTQTTTPDNRVITYDYESSAGYMLWKITSSSRVFEFLYDTLGRRTRLNYPNGATADYTYNNASNLTSILAKNAQQVTLNSFVYTPDNIGNRTSLTDLSGQHVYTYDDTYQVTQATHPTIPTEQFSYNPVGNRVVTGNEDAPTQTLTYTYDYENRLTRVQYTNMDAQYKYDPFGRRIEKNVNGTITRYVYDGPNVVTEYDGNGNAANAYIHNVSIDDPLSIDQGGQTYYYLKDGLGGSVTELMNASASVVASYKYKVFGEIYSQTGSLLQPFTFTGREYDPESNLYYYRARYYDPRAGRFLAKDPIGFAGGDVNLYRYVRNNPINHADPLGLLVGDYHFLITYVAAQNSDYSFLQSLKLAWDVMREDRNTTDTNANAANIHAMAGEISPGTYQTREQALARTMDIIQNGPLSSALHAGQDLPGHNGESMEQFGWNWATAKHYFWDVFDIPAVLEAYKNSKDILKTRHPCK